MQLVNEAPCVTLMRCNWLLEQRGVEADDLQISSLAPSIPPMFVSFEPAPMGGGYSSTGKKALTCWEVSGSCFTAAEVAKVVFLPAVDSAEQTFHQ